MILCVCVCVCVYYHVNCTRNPAVSSQSFYATRIDPLITILITRGIKGPKVPSYPVKQYTLWLPMRSRETKFSGANGGQGTFMFTAQETTSRIGNHMRLIYA